jgi:periplasmic copper chaperone A
VTRSEIIKARGFALHIEQKRALRLPSNCAKRGNLFTLSKRAVRIVVAGAVGVLHASATLGHEFKAGDLTVLHPIVRATPSGAKVGGGYPTIRHSGSSPDRLVSVESSAAEAVQVHSMRREGDVVRMSEREGGIPIPAQGEVRFASGSDHLMFQGLKAPFKVG